MQRNRAVSVVDLITRFGGPTRFARMLGKQPSTGTEMKRRHSIPMGYWPDVIRFAAELGIDGITNDALVAMHLAERKVPSLKQRASSHATAE